MTSISAPTKHLSSNDESGHEFRFVASVMLGHSLRVLFACTIAAVFAGAQRVQPITAPDAAPRIGFEQLSYAGAFRLPATESNGDSFSNGGGPIAFNPAHGTLLVGSRLGRVAEISIPEPRNASAIETLPFANYVQPFADPAEGHMREVGDGSALAGLLVVGERLYGTGLIFYDANNTQSVSHFSRPLAIGTPGAGPFLRVGDAGKSGFVAGYMATVPQEWRALLGGSAITGQCCVPIISRTSWGPAAFAWEPADLDQRRPAKATPLVYYDSEHHTLGTFDGAGKNFGGTTTVSGVVLIPGTRTALFFGGNGTGDYCYGNGTSDKSLVGTTGPDGARFCYDPASSDKGQHAYPYHYQVWAYDLTDWAAVRAGKKHPWDVLPYAVSTFTFPTPEPTTRLSGVTFDPASRRIFIAQRQADRDGFSYRSLIHVYRLP